MLRLAAVALVSLAFGLVLRRIRLPAFLGYLLAGVILGPHGVGVVPSEADLEGAGGVGVVLLLFFVGMEMKPDRLLSSARLVFTGTAIQIAVSVLSVLAIGTFLDWPLPRSILLGFVISLSSTAVVLRLLQQRGEANTVLGEHVTGILLTQDVLIAPMLIVVGLLGGGTPSMASVARQVIGIALIAGLVVVITKKKDIRLGIGAWIGNDREYQVLAALILAFAFAVVTGYLELSTALGAFFGGMLVGAAKETHWVHEQLEPFRVVFLTLFFVSVGMLLDLSFLARHWRLVVALSAVTLLTNTMINAGILRVWNHSWRTSFFGASLLAPIGELSFVLAAVGRQTNIVSDFAYQVTVATITLTLAISPLWVFAFARHRPRPAAVS